MLEILKVHGYDQLHLVNRLDRLTSGVLLLPFKKADAVDLQKKIIDFDVTKEYICRVIGEFPTYLYQFCFDYKGCSCESQGGDHGR